MWVRCGFSVSSLPLIGTVHKLKDLTDVPDTYTCKGSRIPSFFLYSPVPLSSKENVKKQIKFQFFEVFFSFCTIAIYAIPCL